MCYALKFTWKLVLEMQDILPLRNNAVNGAESLAHPVKTTCKQLKGFYILVLDPNHFLESSHSKRRNCRGLGIIRASTGAPRNMRRTHGASVSGYVLSMFPGNDQKEVWLPEISSHLCALHPAHIALRVLTSSLFKL